MTARFIKKIATGVCIHGRSFESVGLFFCSKFSDFIDFKSYFQELFFWRGMFVFVLRKEKTKQV